MNQLEWVSDLTVLKSVLRLPDQLFVFKEGQPKKIAYQKSLLKLGHFFSMCGAIRIYFTEGQHRAVFFGRHLNGFDMTDKSSVVAPLQLSEKTVEIFEDRADVFNNLTHKFQLSLLFHTEGKLNCQELKDISCEQQKVGENSTDTRRIDGLFRMIAYMSNKKLTRRNKKFAKFCKII